MVLDNHRCKTGNIPTTSQVRSIATNDESSIATNDKSMTRSTAETLLVTVSRVDNEANDLFTLYSIIVHKSAEFSTFGKSL